MTTARGGSLAPSHARPPLVLRLYVAGGSPNSVMARRCLLFAIAHLSKDEVSLEVVDVLQHPERCLADRVLHTPTLVKLSPAPERRIIGNLTDRDALLATLGIDGAPDA